MNEYALRALTLLEETFGKGGDARTFFSPGRANLIGEHIDYNGGRVLPCSLSLGTYAAARRRDDGRILLVSADMPGETVSALYAELLSLPQEPGSYSRFGWGAYPLGVCAKLARAGFSSGGFEMAVTGSLPRGSGLSSSASLEILTCAVISELYGADLDGPAAARLSLEAERDCAGVNCGIMDQFVCAVGRRGEAVLLDTHTLDYEYIPFDTGDCELLIMNTRKPRRLADSKYNERRAECAEALRLINENRLSPYPSLCAIAPEEFPAAGRALPPVLLRRARHAVTENARTKLAADAMRRRDMTELGRLFNASHDSLRDDYEVTGRELDSIVNAARAQEGVLGARMTGAGFGGCAIALALRGKAGEAARNIARIYRAETGYECEILEASTADAPFGGARG